MPLFQTLMQTQYFVSIINATIFQLFSYMIRTNYNTKSLHSGSLYILYKSTKGKAFLLFHWNMLANCKFPLANQFDQNNRRIFFDKKKVLQKSFKSDMFNYFNHEIHQADKSIIKHLTVLKFSEIRVNKFRIWTKWLKGVKLLQMNYYWYVLGYSKATCCSFVSKHNH